MLVKAELVRDLYFHSPRLIFTVYVIPIAGAYNYIIPKRSRLGWNWSHKKGAATEVKGWRLSPSTMSQVWTCFLIFYARIGCLYWSQFLQKMRQVTSKDQVHKLAIPSVSHCKICCISSYFFSTRVTSDCMTHPFFPSLQLSSNGLTTTHRESSRSC